MPATKLTIANGALRILKERSLTQSELTNGSREPARLFNAVWDDGGVRNCLESGMWKFSKRSVMLDASPSVEPDFGLRYAFDKPTDFVRTIGIWSDPGMREPLSDIRDEAGYWFSDQETIYLSYVSDDAAYGNDYSLWPQNFLKFVQAHFASEIAGPLTAEGKEILKIRKDLLRETLSTDAMSDPTKFLPTGSWVRARTSGRVSREG